MGTRFRILLFFILAGCSFPAYAGTPVAYLNFAAFSTTDGRDYFETYISIIGNSLHYVKNNNNKFSAKAHITLFFKSGDSVVASANFNVTGPELGDTLAKQDFMDVHRFFLKKGNYMLYFTIDDPNDPAHALTSVKQAVHTGYARDTTCISDAEFLSSYTASEASGPYNKYGYRLIPYIYQNYPPKAKMLSFYLELYNTEKFAGPTKKVQLKYTVENEYRTTLQFAGNYTASAILNADTVVPFMAQIPIDKLPSGNYSLSITVISGNNKTLANRKFLFTRESTQVKADGVPAGFEPYFANRDTLEESVRCLGPIANYSEQTVTNSDSIKWISTPALKHFFYYFWLSRDSIYPLAAWKHYLDKVIAVNHTFNSLGAKGYNTDRGRVYLQYGAPNHRIVSKYNPMTYPYEIWHYYTLPDGETDIKFVFYNRDLVSNNYVLLQSNARGETQNPAWQVELYSRLGNPDDIDTQQIQDDLGESVNDEYNDPH
jgi:GWxTD domain-containing protein